MNSPTPEELRFELSSLTLSGKAWGPSEGTPILAIHGWLDNASTFDHLAPLLPEMRIVSVDMAGHGHSDHRPAGVNYHFVDMLYEVVELLDYLGWDRCSLLGHSMGAGVATCVAGLLGHRIQNVLLIEGLGPMTQPPERLTELMRDSFRQWRSLPGKTSPVYATMDEAVEARRIVGEMEIPSVKTLVGRGLVQKNNSYKWRSDPRLRVKSRVYLTEDQILFFIREITAPVLVIEARDTKIQRWRDFLRSRLPEVRTLKHLVLPGGHHLHLDDPLPVAEAIRDFVQNPPASHE